MNILLVIMDVYHERKPSQTRQILVPALMTLGECFVSKFKWTNFYLMMLFGVIDNMARKVIEK